MKDITFFEKMSYASCILQMRRCALLFATMLLTACVNLGTGVGEADGLTSSWVRPEDPQEAVGRKEHPLVLAKYGGEYSNPNAEKMLAVIVGKLVAVSENPARVYKVTLLNSPQVNAFALPGGYLYVTRGLLALANDSSELAAVLAHEMAHVSANHALTRQQRANSTAVSQKVVSDVLNDSIAGQVALAANQLRFYRFSQEQELQADTIGIRLIGRAGYDPYAAERFLRTMSSLEVFQGNEMGFNAADELTSTHPSTPKRIELARKQARFFGGPGIGDRGKERYHTGIDGLLFGDSPEEGFVRGSTFSH